MAAVNPQGSLQMTLRQERAALTRRRIIDAARRRFSRDGYAATTLKAIAEEAGVAVQTVYAVFGSKAAILEALRAIAVMQPEADAAFGEAMAGPTPQTRLRSFARSIRQRWERAGDIVKVNQDAVRADPSLRGGIESGEARRTGGITAFVQGIETDFRLGLEMPRCIAVVHALSLYQVYEELTGGHGWSPDVYEAWLGEALISGLLPEATRPARLPDRA